MSNRILDYPEATSITSNDYILLDNEDSGAKCIKASALNINMDNYTIKEASGAIASFDDGEDLPLAFLGAYITAIQDLHGYDYPWVGGSGKNKFDKSTMINGLYSDENFTVIQDTSTVYRSYKYYLKAGTYTFSASKEVRILRSVIDGVYSSSQSDLPYTFSVASDGYVGFSFRNKDDTDWNSNTNCQMELGNQATSYAPYSNECPIIGWDEVNVVRDGKNLLNETSAAFDVESSNYLQQLIPINTDSVINISITDKDTSVDISGAYLGAFAAEGDSTQGYSWIVANGATQSSSLVITGKRYITVYPKNKLDAILARFNIQVEIGSEATSYEPYNGNTYSLTFTDGTNPLTVYGGYVDLVSGMLVIDKKKFLLAPTTSQIASADVKDCRIELPEQAKGYTLADTKAQCNKLKVSGYSEAFDNHVHFNNAIYASFYLSTEIGATKQAWVDWFTANQIELAYCIATPLTYSLTKQQIRSLVGVNNIFADTGDSVVDYRKLWVKPEM